MNREDISECEILEDFFDLDKLCLSCEDSYRILYDFFKKILSKSPYIDKLSLDNNTIKEVNFLIEKMGSYLNGDFSENDFYNYRSHAWDNYENLKGSNSLIFRVIFCGLFDKETLEKSKPSAPMNMIELIFSVLYDLNFEYCKLFREYLENHPIMQKYKINE